MAQGAQLLGSGGHRRTYLRPNKSKRTGKQLRRYVYKFPIDTWVHISHSELANVREHRHFREHPKGRSDGTRFARSRLLPNGVLVAEYIKPLTARRSVPQWAYQWDCAQVGRDRHGIVKLYDAGEA